MEVPLKVHLPELVRSLVFESPVRAHSLLRRTGHPVVTRQDRVHGAFRQRSFADPFQARLDLACTPAIPIPDRQHFFLDRLPTASRGMPRPTRTIGQPGGSLLPIPPPPFVTGLAADPEPAAQLTEIDPLILGQGHKLLPQTHTRTLPPRHNTLPQKRSSCHCAMCYLCPRTCVTYVSGIYRPKGRGNLNSWHSEFFSRPIRL